MDSEEVMEKEEGGIGALQAKELPFIPFSGGAKCQLSHDELAISPSRPGRIPFVSHLPTDPALRQTNVMLLSSSSSVGLVLVCNRLSFRSGRSMLGSSKDRREFAVPVLIRSRMASMPGRVCARDWGLGTAEAIGAIANFNCSRALASGPKGGTGHCRWAEAFRRRWKSTLVARGEKRATCFGDVLKAAMEIPPR